MRNTSALYSAAAKMYLTVIARPKRTQDIRRRIANCFVAVETATHHVAAYYTISAASIPLVHLPPDETKRLPRYPTVPAVRIGRLAAGRRCD